MFSINLHGLPCLSFLIQHNIPWGGPPRKYVGFAFVASGHLGLPILWNWNNLKEAGLQFALVKEMTFCVCLWQAVIIYYPLILFQDVFLWRAVWPCWQT